MAKLYFRYSSMNAGKSTALLQVEDNYLRLGHTCQLWTAAIDDRFGTAKITSRLGLSRDAHVFHHDTDFSIQKFENIACILLDEAQFLTKLQVQQLHKIAHTKNIPIICYGLRSDFKGEGFEGSMALLVLADAIEEIKTVCQCGRKATMVARYFNGIRQKEGPQTLIGDTEYRSLCPACFYEE